jgi:hypothetical protein
MTSDELHPDTDSMLDALSARDIAALYLGHRQMLADLQELQLAGKRVAGGLSARINLASAYLQLLESRLGTLATRDPDKLRDVLVFLKLSSLDVRSVAKRLERFLDS